VAPPQCGETSGPQTTIWTDARPPARYGSGIEQPRLIIQLPHGGAVERQFSAEPPATLSRADVIVESGPTDDEGVLEALTGGQVVFSVPSPQGLEREAEEVRRAIRHAGTGDAPLVIVVQAAEQLRDEELAAVVDAADHAARVVILRVIRDG
jgi:hypothetical protein